MTTTTAFEIVTSPAAIEPASTFGLLCREALRAVALRSNEAPVRDLAWAARGL